MRINRLFYTAALLLLAAALMPAQNIKKTGTTAAQFLKINIGPRAVGMGGAFTASAEGVNAMYWNPAGLASSYNNEAYFNHINWFADVNHDYAGVASHLPGLGTIGVQVSMLSMDEMEVRTIEQPEGTGERFTSGGMSVGLTYARELTENFSIGFNFKYIREHLWHMAASGFAVDIGTLYRIPVLNELRLAASISNFGTKMKLEGRDNLMIQQIGGADGNLINTKVELDSWDLPLLFRIGVAADIVQTDDMRLTTAVDATHPNDHTEYVNVGAEYAWNEMVFIRGGYKGMFEADTEQGLTLGFGLNYRIAGAMKIAVDYAYQDYNRLATGGDVHYFSVGFNF